MAEPAMVEDSYDLVVVGAGIAGSALAARMAQAGRSVLVLEQHESYRDRTRGETIAPWGVREVQRLGVEDVLLGAGGQYTELFIPYDENLSPEEAETRALPYSRVAPDVPGVLNVGHPEASEALSRHGADCGAMVRRGVSSVRLALGSPRTVAWSDSSGDHTVGCRLITGADGRTSTVRKQAGITLEERPAVTFGAGVLVKGDCGFSGRNTLGTAGREMFFAFPRAGDLTRLYLLVAVDRQTEFTGPRRLETFLGCFPNDAFPASKALAGAEVIGPCGGSPMTDAWTTTPPVRDGLVLVGDAAGWNDPIIGQGLSIALRDARMVAEVLESSDDWSPRAFGGYVEERAERMRRLAVCAHVHTMMRCSFTDEARSRRARWSESLPADRVLLGQSICSLTGAEAFGPECFTEDAVEGTLTL